MQDAVSEGKSMNKIPIYALILLASCFHDASAADTRCLSVTNNSWSKQGSEFGITYVLWEAELANVCAVSYDADIVIRFIGVDGKEIYQSLDLISVPRRAKTTTSREFNIPDHEFEKLADVVVTIREERERPF